MIDRLLADAEDRYRCYVLLLLLLDADTDARLLLRKLMQ